MRKLRIIITLAKSSLSSEMVYQWNFLLEFFHVILQFVFYFLTLSVIFTQTKELAGWSKDEILLLWGIGQLSSGLFLIFLKPGLDRLPDLIHDGGLDFYLVKPFSAKFLVTFSVVNLMSIPFMLSGVVLSAYSLIQLNISLNIAEIILLMFIICSHLTVVYSLYLFLMTFYFWLLESNIEHLYLSFGYIVRYPLDIFNNIGKFIFLYIIPLGFAAYIPVRVILHKASWQEILLVFPITLIIYFTADKFWHFALKSYTSASS